MGKDENEICGRCRWHWCDMETQGWVCCNSESDYYADWTEYEDGCDEFEERN